MAEAKKSLLSDGVRGLFRRVASAGKTTLALVGVGSLVSLAVTYQLDGELDKKTTETQGDGTKRVLVIPFHRLQVVEKKARGFSSLLSRAIGGNESEEKNITIELQDLVDIIHAAAADPTIVSLYCTFGKGFGFSTKGHAHIEEIRNAIRVFNESHRLHPEPNIDHAPNWPEARKKKTKKVSYAFADTFDHPSDTGNKEFYLASIFTHVHLQPRGSLHLLGMSTSSFFLRDTLDKYGIKAHVFKHGKYKNAPNVFTEKGFTKEHMENTQSFIEDINQHMCKEITRSRSLPKTFDSHMWKAINSYGALSPLNAQEVGLIDYLPRIDPLDSLVCANKDDKARREMKERWSSETNLDKFIATEKISLEKYALLRAKQEKEEEKKWKMHARLKQIYEKGALAAFIMEAVGLPSPNFNIEAAEFPVGNEKDITREKIALVTIDSIINDKMAQKVIASLRKIKNDQDTKCVVLRVDSPGGTVPASEAILEECKDLQKPIVCSMGNYAASGGYYVASHSRRIFALPNTITGSIGIFNVRLDLTGMASQYGINVQHVSTGTLSQVNNPFHPMTKAMYSHFYRNIDRGYDSFKEIVSSGRGLSMEEVEAIAQGRVWTGGQALEIGLVDEIGGISRAVSYAKHHFTSGNAKVEVWPKPLTAREAIMKQLEAGEDQLLVDSPSVWEGLVSFLAGHVEMDKVAAGQNVCTSHSGLGTLRLNTTHHHSPGMMLTMDETDAICLALEESLVPACFIPPSSPFWV